MPSVNMRQLRETRRLKAWLRAGTTVELREPRAKKIFGERVLSVVDDLIKDQGGF
jgi:hypothetical protein